MKNNNLIIFDQEDLDKCVRDLPVLDTVDLIKITTNAIREKIFSEWQIREFTQECRKNWIECYIWWGITDSMIEDFQIDEHIEDLQSLWIKVIEMSAAMWEKVEPDVLNRYVKKLSKDFDRIIVEIWSKAENIFSRDYKVWQESVQAAICAWASDIVIEWWMWKVWIYNNDNRVKTLLLMYILKEISNSWYNWNVIMETIKVELQSYVISLLWSRVKLWNILYEEYFSIYSIEKNRTQCGNKQDEILNKFYEVIDEIFTFCKEHKIDPNYFFFNSNFFNLYQGVDKCIQDIKLDMESLLWNNNDSWIITSSNPEFLLKQMWINI